jgi:hypothetical protein
MIEDGATDRDFGVVGEMLTAPRDPTPAPPPPEPLVIEHWSEEERAAAMRDSAEPEQAPQVSAVAAMLAAEPDNEPPAPNLDPPVVDPPLIPPAIPPPDWRSEERERAAREHTEQALAEEQPSRYPPPRREQP